MAPRVRKLLIGVLKYGISLSILTWLFWRAAQDENFAKLLQQQKRWDLLLAALVVGLSAVSLTFVRWYLLVRALGIEFSIRDAFRLGFVGYLFNFVTLGVVGGDAVKAAFIAHEQPKRRTEAVATVVIDRLLGLYALFLLASAAFLTVDLDAVQVRDPQELQAIKLVCRVSFTLTIVGAAGMVLLMLPGFTSLWIWDTLTGLPKVGGVLERIIGAVRMYRKRLGLMVLVLVMSLATHSLFTFSVFLIALGLPGNEPPLGTHFVIVPIANLAGAIPLPGGMGAMEAALDALYHAVSPVSVAERQGFVIALGFRIITLLIALIGVVYYLGNRREVKQLLKEAEDQGDEPVAETRSDVEAA